MDNSEADPDGYTESTRRYIVDTAVSRVRARGIEPHPDLLLLYERYIKGELCRSELQIHLHNRLANLMANLQHQSKRREHYEQSNSHEGE